MGGEFGRTSIFSQGKANSNNYGRDHHPGCFTKWMARGKGGGGFFFFFKGRKWFMGKTMNLVINVE